MDTLSAAQLEDIFNISRHASVVAPSVSDVKKLINIAFVNRDQRYANFYAWHEVLKSVRGRNRKVLDTACGRGEVAQILASKGHTVFACDIDDAFMADRGKIDFRNIDLDKRLPYDDNRFDSVINCEALQYLNCPRSFIRETARVLRSGGNLILSVPNIHSIRGRYTFFKTAKLVFYDSEESTAHNAPTIIYLPYLLQLLEASGFRVVEIKGTVPVTCFKLRVINTMLGSLISDIDRKDLTVRFSHSLVINAELSK